jgi:hypothetical protein
MAWTAALSVSCGPKSTPRNGDIGVACTMNPNPSACVIVPRRRPSASSTYHEGVGVPRSRIVTRTRVVFHRLTSTELRIGEVPEGVEIAREP